MHVESASAFPEFRRIQFSRFASAALSLCLLPASKCPEVDYKYSRFLLWTNRCAVHACFVFSFIINAVRSILPPAPHLCMQKVFSSSWVNIQSDTSILFYSSKSQMFGNALLYLDSLGEAANLGICCESLLSYSGRRQLQLPCLCGSASSVNTQLCGLDSEAHLQFLNVQEEHGWAGVLIPTHHLCVNERHTKLLTVSDLSLSRSALFGFRFVHCQQRILHISRWRIALQCPELGSVLFINF